MVARPLVLARAAVALLAALALLAAAALAQPVVTPVVTAIDPLARLGKPAYWYVFKLWSDVVTGSGGTSVGGAPTISWTNQSTYYVYGPWAPLVQASWSSAQQRVCAYVNFNATYSLYVKPTFTANGGTITVNLYANGSCGSGGLVASGTLILSWSASYGTNVVYGSWVQVKASNLVISASTSASYITMVGAYLDGVPQSAQSSDLTVPASPRRVLLNASVWLSGMQASTPASAMLFNGTHTYLFYAFSPPRTAPYTIATVTPAHLLRILPPQALNATLFYADGSTSSRVALPEAEHYMWDVKQAVYLNLSSSAGWLKIALTSQYEVLKPAAPQAGAVPVTFFVNDYGQGYTHLAVYTPASRLAWRDEISSATRSAVAYLQPYGNYILALRKPGEERVLGPVTVSQTQYSLTVLPQLQPAPPPSTAVVYYNSSLPGYVVDVSCASPPCTITLVKKQVTQPQLLSAEFTVPSGGATIAPHLFSWYFDGVDDYVFLGRLADGTGKPLNVYGWPALTDVTHVFLFYPYNSAVTQMIHQYGQDFGLVPRTFFYRDAYFTSVGIGMVAVRGDTLIGYGPAFTSTTTPSVDAFRNRWVQVTRTITRRWMAVWLGSTLARNDTIASGDVTVLDYDMSTTPCARYSLGAKTVADRFAKMMSSFLIIYSRTLTVSELNAIMASRTVDAAQLEAFFDPTWFNGTHYVSLTGGYVGKGYNGAARIPANETWLWLVQDFPGDGKLHFRFFPEGSRATVRCGSTLLDVQLGWSDVAVQVPAGESCRVAVHVAPQPYILETASYTCGEARCRFTWITSDPFLEASVADAAGSTYVVFSGTSLPQQPGGLPGLADLVNWLAGSTGLDYLVGPGAVQAFLVALSSVLLLIAFSTAGSWEFGLLAAAAGLVLLPVLLGAPPLAVPAGLIIALAALSLMLRKEREE
ncbi:MAG: hypothetical protein QXT28_09980 [Thermofilaceae archaeon]